MTDDQLDRLIKSINDVAAAIRARAPAATSSASTSNAIAPADDADLDSQYGDEEVRKDPPRWKGESMVGRRLSETTPEFLDSYAGFKMWQAAKDAEAGDEKKADYRRRDAARALGWKARLLKRQPQTAKPATVSQMPSDGDELPF